MITKFATKIIQLPKKLNFKFGQNTQLIRDSDPLSQTEIDLILGNDHVHDSKMIKSTKN